MEVILLEKVRNLGNIGDKVSVKAGHARNHLIPYGKAVVATGANLEKFEKMRAELEENAAKALKLAQERAAKLTDVVVTIASKATEEGKLFGSITASNIAEALGEMSITADKQEISMPQGALRNVGEYDVSLLLHSDVVANIKVNITAVDE